MSKGQNVAVVLAACSATAMFVAFAANMATIVNVFAGDGQEAPAGPSTSIVAPAVPPQVPTTKPMPADEAPGQPQPSTPQKFHGKWSGQVFQNGSSRSPYVVELTVSGGSTGQQVATVAYPGLKCGGVWVLQAAWDNRIRAVETVDYGTSNCVVVTIDLQMRADGQVFYSFWGTEGTGVLHRVS